MEKVCIGRALCLDKGVRDPLPLKSQKTTKEEEALLAPNLRHFRCLNWKSLVLTKVSSANVSGRKLT